MVMEETLLEGTLVTIVLDALDVFISSYVLYHATFPAHEVFLLSLTSYPSFQSVNSITLLELL